MKKKLTTLFVLLALLLIPTSAVLAQDPGGSGDVFLFGQNYTLESGETLNGNAAVIGGNISVEEDAKVNGDLVLVGGNLKLDGSATGDVVLVGGNLTVSDTVGGNIVVVGGQILLTESAVVEGDVTTMGGQVNKEPGAEVKGNTVNNAPPVDLPEVPEVPSVPAVPSTPDSPTVEVNTNPLWDAAGVLGRAIAVALIGMLLTLFLQPQLDRAASVAAQQPFLAGGYGLLTLLVGPVAIVILAVTILLIPIALIAALILPLAWLFGMIALGQEVGDRFAKAVNQTWAPVLATGLGTFLLVLVTGVVGLIPCVGWMPSFIVTLLAVGTTVMTVFGTRSAPGQQPPAAAVEVIPPAS